MLTVDPDRPASVIPFQNRVSIMESKVAYYLLNATTVANEQLISERPFRQAPETLMMLSLSHFGGKFKMHAKNF